MIHHNMNWNFRLKPWPFLSGQLRRTEDFLKDVDVEGLAEHLMQKLHSVNAFMVFSTTFTLINVCSPKSGLSWGFAKPPEKKYWPFDARLIFTFQKTSEKPSVYTKSTPKRVSSDVRWWGKNSPNFVSVGISNSLARDFGCYAIQYSELEGLYTGMGLLTKNLAIRKPDPQRKQVLYNGNAVIVSSRLPYNRWGDAVSMWTTPWLGDTHIDTSWPAGVLAIAEKRCLDKYKEGLLLHFTNDLQRMSLTQLDDTYPMQAITDAYDLRVQRGLSLKLPQKAMLLLRGRTEDVLTQQATVYAQYIQYLKEE